MVQEWCFSGHWIIANQEELSQKPPSDTASRLEPLTALGLTGGVAGTGNISSGYFYNSNRANKALSGSGTEGVARPLPPLGVSPLLQLRPHLPNTVADYIWAIGRSGHRRFSNNWPQNDSRNVFLLGNLIPRLFQHNLARQAMELRFSQ